ncbi:MAG: type II secretion system protein GspM [Nitrospinaceae bacterium]
MKQINLREKRILFLGAALMTVYFLVEFAALPLYRMQEKIDQEIENKILFISRYYAILNQKNYFLKKEKSNQILEGELDRRFLGKKTPSLAGADLQRILQDKASQGSVHIVQVNTEKPKYTDGLLTVPVRVTVRSTLRNLTGFLLGIENHAKFLVVESLETRRINRNEPEYLESRLEVEPEPPEKKI